MDGEPIDVIGRDEIVSAVARAALLGARGNSRRDPVADRARRGRGARVAPRRAGRPDPRRPRPSLARPTPPMPRCATPRRARCSPRCGRWPAGWPTTSRTWTCAGSAPKPRRRSRTSCWPRCSTTRSRRAWRRWSRGPEQLAILRESGVVDAGRLRPDGHHRRLPRGAPGRLRARARASVRPGARCTGPSTSRRAFATARTSRSRAQGLDAARFTPLLEDHRRLRARGRRRAARCACTCTPTSPSGRSRSSSRPARSLASTWPTCTSRWPSARRGSSGEPAAQAACAVVAVASGAGVKRLYEELGVLVVDGGATMNPSTYELLAGIHAAPGAEVVVLPNSANVIMAAERAAELSDKPAQVIPPRAPQEGLVALLAFDPAAGCDENAQTVRRPAGALSIGGVAPAARDDAQGRFSAGDAVGYAGGELVAWGDPADTLAATLARLGRRRRARHLPRGRAAPAGSRATSSRASRTASRSSSTRAASPRGGGCSARSEALRLDRTRCRQTRPIRSYPRPSLLAEHASRVRRRSRSSASIPGATSSSTCPTPTATGATSG